MSLDVGEIHGGLRLDTVQWETPFDRMIAATAAGSQRLSQALLDAARESNVSLAAIAAQSAKTSTAIEGLAASGAASMGRLESSLGDVRLLMSGVDQSTAATAAGMTRLERSSAAAVAGLTRLDGRLGDIERSMIRANNAANRTATTSEQGFSDLRILLSAVDGTLLSVNRHLEATAILATRVHTSGGGAAASTGELANGALALAGVLGTVNPRIGQLVSAMTAVKSVAAEAGVSLGKATAIVGGAVGVLEAAKLAFDFTAEGVRLAADMEQVRISFETMIGDVSLAHRTLEELKLFTDTTPFKFADVAPAAKQLLAMGINAKDLVGTLRRLGDVSSGLSQPLGDIAYLFGKVKSEGVANEIDMKEFARRGVPIFSELAKVLHTSEMGVRELVTAGKVGFPEVQAAIESMTNAGGKFHDLTIKQSKSIKGELTTLSDAWDKVERTAGEAFLAGGAGNRGIEELTKKVNALTPSAERFGEALRHAFEAVLPLAEKTLNLAGSLAEKLTGSEGAGTVSGSANPSVTKGVDQSTDPKSLLSAAGNLSAARKAMAASIRKVDTSFDGVNEGGLFVHTQDVSAQVKAKLDESYKSAGSTATVDALDSLVAKLSAKQTSGQPLSADESKQLRDAVAAVGAEVDGFRSTLLATKTDLQATQKQFEADSIRAKMNTNRIRGSELDWHVGVVQHGLDVASPSLSAAADALAKQRNVEAKAELAAKEAASAKALSPATAAATLPTPATAATSAPTASPVAIDPSATPRERRQEATAAAKAERIAERSAGNTADDLAMAHVAELDALGERMDADLAKVAATHGDDLRNAKTPQETAAVNQRIAAEQDAVRRRYADLAAKAKAEQAKKDKAAADAASKAVADEAKREAAEAKRAAQEVADYQLEAQLTVLRAYGRDFDAAMLEAEHRYAERIDKATSDEERLTAKVALETTKRQLIKDRRDEIAKRTGVSLPVTATANAAERLRTAKSPAAKALAEIDLREAKGGTLSAADQARRDRLRQSTGTGADGLATDADPSSVESARARMRAAKTPQQRALAAIEIREASGQRLSPDEVARRDRLREQLGVDPADRQSPTAAAAAVASIPPSSATPPQAASGDVARSPSTAAASAAERAAAAALTAIDRREAAGQRISPADVARRNRLREQLGIDRDPSAVAGTAGAAARPASTTGPTDAPATDQARVAARFDVVRAAKMAELSKLSAYYAPLLAKATSPAEQYQLGHAYADAQAAIERKYTGPVPDASASGQAAAAARAATTRPSTPQYTAGSAEASRAVAGLNAARGGGGLAAGGFTGQVQVKPLDAKEIGQAVGDYLKPFVMREIREVQAAAKNAAWADDVGRDL